MRRTPIRRRPSRKEPMSAEVYETVMSKRAKGRCEAACSPACSRSAGHWHHRKLRSGGGQHTVPNGLAVCAACHSWIHSNPAEAKEHGWIVSKWREPENVPALVGGRKVTLLPDGSTVPSPAEEILGGAE